MSKMDAIEVKGLWKRYGLPYQLKKPWKMLTEGRRDAGTHALKDVSFVVKEGESLGVVGRNGAGKSTLLKVLAGVTPPTKGAVTVRGQIFPMIELNAGIHPELTGRENVFLLAAVMGLDRGDRQRLIPEIEGFCELGEWFDKPVRMFSTGMKARLGFAVAMKVHSDVLLIDEVLAVGDLPFQRKCLTHMTKLREQGSAIVFVTHSLRMIERMCEKAIYLDNGNLVCHGPSSKVVTEYTKDATSHQLQNIGEAQVLQRPEHLLHVTHIELLQDSGSPSQGYLTGRPLTIRVRYRVDQDLKGVAFGIGFLNEQQVYVSGFSSYDLSHDIPRGEGHFECHLPELTLLSGIYSISMKSKDASQSLVFECHDILYFQVVTPEELRLTHEYGLVMMNAKWVFSEGGNT